MEQSQDLSRILIAALVILSMSMLFAVVGYVTETQAKSQRDLMQDQMTTVNFDQLTGPCLTAFTSTVPDSASTTQFVDNQTALNPRIWGLKGDGAVLVQDESDHSVTVKFDIDFPRPVPMTRAVFLNAFVSGSGTLFGSPTWTGVVTGEDTYLVTTSFKIAGLNTAVFGSQGLFHVMLSMQDLDTESSTQVIANSNDAATPIGLRFEATLSLGVLDFKMYSDTVIAGDDMVFSVHTLFAKSSP